MLEDYWPSNKECKSCINTDAEATAEHVLLAVHEPMTLSVWQNGIPEDGHKTEYDFLDHILKTEYPVPILGPAGSGKSHIVRWLDAKLKVRPECDDWHIVRIPKSASLRDVLTILLRDLKGTDFESVRQEIRSVGDNLKISEVADILIIFISHTLSDLFTHSQREKKDLIDSGKEISASEKERFKMLERHAAGGLQALLSDPNFKQRLVQEDKCIFQRASRFTKGKGGEPGHDDFADSITLDDLDFQNNFNLDDLSLEARNYIRNKGMTTNPKVHQEAVDLLNEVMDVAMNKAFSNFYQFKQGSFIDLFNEIRRHLKAQNRTLVVLVEDLATISAIKDVLLDSLLKDSTYAGVQELCSIRSVFAVTDGSGALKSYTERSGTIGSRQGGVEWHIESNSADENQTISRIEDFCGRYLNAARFGSKRLKDEYDPAAEHQDWPAIWHANDEHQRESVEQFGFSPKGYPLFPLNKAAIRALSFTYCTEASVLKFNPRTILIKILKEILENFREKYVSNDFPDFNVNSQLQITTELELAIYNALGINTLRNHQKIRTLITYWGYQAETLAELARVMPPVIAKEFGCDELYNVLTETTPSQEKLTPQVVIPLRTSLEIKPVETPVDKLREIANDVDQWFKEEAIPQKVAASIRRVLRNAVDAHWKKSDYGKWLGVKNLPKAFTKNETIYIHYNQNNTDAAKRMGFFGDEKKGFGDDAARYKGFLIAFLRHQVSQNWSYVEGYADYCRYQDFVDDWVAVTCGDIVEICRKKSENEIRLQLKAAVLFYPNIGTKSDVEKIEILCQTAENLSAAPKARTGIEAWDDYKEEQIENWPSLQDAWLDNFLPGNYYALEGDVIKNVLRGAIDSENPVSTSLQKRAQQTARVLASTYTNIELIKGCNNQESFNQVLKDLKAVIETLADNKQFRVNSDMTPRKFINSVEKIRKANTWPATKALLELTSDFEAISALKNLNNFDADAIRNLDSLLEAWREVFMETFGRLKTENLRRGSGERSALRTEVQSKIDECSNVLKEIRESLM